jgi:hypothetical protein
MDILVYKSLLKHYTKNDNKKEKTGILYYHQGPITKCFINENDIKYGFIYKNTFKILNIEKKIKYKHHKVLTNTIYYLMCICKDILNTIFIFTNALCLKKRRLLDYNQNDNKKIELFIIDIYYSIIWHFDDGLKLNQWKKIYENTKIYNYEDYYNYCKIMNFNLTIKDESFIKTFIELVSR